MRRSRAGSPPRRSARSRSCSKQAGWSVGDVDLFEVNEAFAVVAMVADARPAASPHDKLNVNGGACALGHPIGASGARIIVTLLAALQERGLKRGVASPLHRRRRSHRGGDGNGVSWLGTRKRLDLDWLTMREILPIFCST